MATKFPEWAYGKYRIYPANNPSTWWVRERKSFLGIPYWRYFSGYTIPGLPEYSPIQRIVYHSLESAKQAIIVEIQRNTNVNEKVYETWPVR